MPCNPCSPCPPFTLALQLWHNSCLAPALGTENTFASVSAPAQQQQRSGLEPQQAACPHNLLHKSMLMEGKKAWSQICANIARSATGLGERFGFLMMWNFCYSISLLKANPNPLGLWLRAGKTAKQEYRLWILRISVKIRTDTKIVTCFPGNINCLLIL